MPILRVAYAIEYLIALIATFTVWSQVVGQGHLDLMAWYWKLGLSACIAYAIVRATISAAEQERAWNSRVLRWLGVLLALALACAAVTYYYHLYEPADEEEEEDNVSVVLTALPRPGFDRLP